MSRKQFKQPEEAAPTQVDLIADFDARLGDAMTVVDPGYLLDNDDAGITYTAPVFDLAKMNPQVLSGAPAAPVVSVYAQPDAVQPVQGVISPASTAAPKYRVEIQSYFDPTTGCSALRQVLTPC